jgi:type I restriction enzyme, S subunit
MNPKLSKLGDLVTIMMGQSPPGDSYNQEGKGEPLLNGPTEFGAIHPTERQWTTSPKKRCQPGDILFCVRGATAGRLNIADKQYCLGRGLAAIRGKSGKFDDGFLRHVLANGYATFQASGVGSTFINISSENLSSFIVPELPIGTQKRIAAILDQAEALRSLRRQSIGQLDALSRSVFLEMFGDPATNPKGWDIRKLADFVDEFRYGSSNKSQATGKPILRIPNVVGGTLNLTELKTVPIDDAEFERIKMQDGDILFVRTNGNPDFVGRCAVFDRRLVVNTGFSEDEFVFASYLIRARISSKLIDTIFLREFLLGSSGRRQLRASCKTSAGQFNINIPSLSAISFPLPPLALQQEFADRIQAIEALKAQHRESLAKMDTLFASLQHRAFRGEL